ncbi:MAG: L-ribulose-5-phosphate 4-epimerase [Verrucomicrobiota bacterium]
MLEVLKEEVCKANLELVAQGLVRLTWGNVSGIDREQGLMAIKPSGISYEALKPSNIVLVNLEGEQVEGELKPSSDTKTHLELYKAWPGIGGITHTHSTYATTFCQAGRDLPCFGTTHADHFAGTVPLCRFLTEEEVAEDYEKHTGTAIIEHFEKNGLDPVAIPSVLQHGHAPFSWGKTAGESVKNAVALEMCAFMALGGVQLNPAMESLPSFVLDKHYQRKHGPNAYYGQK